VSIALSYCQTILVYGVDLRYDLKYDLYKLEHLQLWTKASNQPKT